MKASIPFGCHVPSHTSSVAARAELPAAPKKSSSASPLCGGGGDSANNSSGTPFRDVGVHPVWSELRNLNEFGDVKVASAPEEGNVCGGEPGAGSASAVTSAVLSASALSAAGRAAVSAFSSLAAPAEPTEASGAMLLLRTSHPPLAKHRALRKPRIRRARRGPSFFGRIPSVAMPLVRRCLPLQGVVDVFARPRRHLSGDPKARR